MSDAAPPPPQPVDKRLDQLRPASPLETAATETVTDLGSFVADYRKTAAFNKLRPDIRSAIDRLTGSGSFESLMGLEAVVRTTGRPSLPVINNRVDWNAPEAAQYMGSLIVQDDLIQKVTPSIGRIDLDGRHVGTGFVVAPNHILTNRHVAESIARIFLRPDQSETWLFTAGQASINFVAEDGAQTTRRFRLRRIVSWGPDAISGVLDLNKIDAALIEAEPTNAQGDSFPSPLVLARDGHDVLTTEANIVAIGYPGAAVYTPQGAEPTEDELKLIAALRRIFAYRSGIKRLSPGMITILKGKVSDAHSGVFVHDCSTLPGSSGCVLLSLESGGVVAGLHFGGQMLHANYAIATTSLGHSFFDPVAVAWA